MLPIKTVDFTPVNVDGIKYEKEKEARKYTVRRIVGLLNVTLVMNMPS